MRSFRKFFSLLLLLPLTVRCNCRGNEPIEVKDLTPEKLEDLSLEEIEQLSPEEVNKWLSKHFLNIRCIEESYEEGRAQLCAQEKERWLKGYFPSAAADAEEKEVALLLRLPFIDVNDKRPDEYSRGPVIYRLVDRHPDDVKALANFKVIYPLLRKAGVDPNVKVRPEGESDTSTTTPLLRTIEREDFAMFEVLMEDPKIDPNLKASPWGPEQFPLHESIRQALKGDRRYFDRLMQHPKIDVNVQTEGGCAPIHAAVLYSRVLSLRADNIHLIEVIEALLDHPKIDPTLLFASEKSLNSTDVDTRLRAKRSTILQLAAQNGHDEVVRLLFKRNTATFDCHICTNHISNKPNWQCRVCKQRVCLDCVEDYTALFATNVCPFCKEGVFAEHMLSGIIPPGESYWEWELDYTLYRSWKANYREWHERRKALEQQGTTLEKPDDIKWPTHVFKD